MDTNAPVLVHFWVKLKPFRFTLINVLESLRAVMAFNPVMDPFCIFHDCSYFFVRAFSQHLQICLML